MYAGGMRQLWQPSQLGGNPGMAANVAGLKLAGGKLQCGGEGDHCMLFLYYSIINAGIEEIYCDPLAGSEAI